MFSDLDSVSVHKHTKEEQYPVILTSRLVNIYWYGGKLDFKQLPVEFLIFVSLAN